VTRRRFNRKEKNALYLGNAGHCARCDTELEPGWHGDHIQPYIHGGQTKLSNGQPLCAVCNLKKGSSMTWTDKFRPRSFQQELVKVIRARVVAGESLTVALVSPGSGKTLGYQAAVTDLIRHVQEIDFIVVYVPRVILAKQAEITWRHEDPHDPRRELGHFELFDPKCRLERIRHRGNISPLLPAGARHEGFVTTYQSLVSYPDLHTGWAKEHAGRFLLVGDEAQFLGAPLDEGDETSPKAGQHFEQLAQYARHTLLLTGTEERADGRKLILCDDLYKQDGKGKWHLGPHVEARYRDGIALGYLRQFDAVIPDPRVVWWPTEDERIEYDLSKSSELPPEKRAKLARILRNPKIWQPMCDETVKRLGYARKTNPGYLALIACMEQQDAKAARQYLHDVYPSLRVGLAISEDGPAAEQALKDFKVSKYDILVTVRKAFIGYDCPEIAVVCCLTNYRNIGHLMQLVMRGGRVWDPKICGQPARSQRLYLILPGDPMMAKFIEYLRREQAEGLREPGEGPGPGPGEGHEGRLEDAWISTIRGANYERDLTAEEYAESQAILDQYGPITTPGQVQQLFLDLGMAMPGAAKNPVPQPQSAPKTEQEIVKELKSEAARQIGAYLRALGHEPNHVDYGKVRAQWTNRINDAFVISGTDEITTADKAKAYLAHVGRWPL
jgi:superfamily II DNA or RNA helicase